MHEIPLAVHEKLGHDLQKGDPLGKLDAEAVLGRIAGTRNADYDQSRAALARKVRSRLMQPDGARASFRELAAAAEVGTGTLRHYFATREGAIRAALELCYAEGIPYLLAVTRPPDAPLRASLEPILVRVLEGMRLGLGPVHALGLAAGLRDPEIGPAYVDRVLEPTLQAFEARLAHHLARGELRAGSDLRVAALALIAPLLLAALHQRELGGVRCRPLDLQALVGSHLDAWMRGWGTSDPREFAGSTSPERL